MLVYNTYSTYGPVPYYKNIPNPHGDIYTLNIKYIFSLVERAPCEMGVCVITIFINCYCALIGQI